MADRPAVGEPVGIRRGPYGCGPDGLHWVLEPPTGEKAHCPCGTVSRFTSPDRYCMPVDATTGFGTCYCGDCPHYAPAPAVDYRRVVARMQEERREKEQRRRRELERLSGGPRKRPGHWSSKPR